MSRWLAAIAGQVLAGGVLALLLSLPVVAADFPIADRVVIRKTERKLMLLSGDQVLRSSYCPGACASRA